MASPIRPPVGHTSAAVQLAVVGVAGIVAGGLFAALVSRSLAPLAGWDVAALSWLILVWRRLWPLNGGQTARLAVHQDPNRAVRDAVLLIACLASLLAVGLVVVNERSAPPGLHRDLYGGLGILSVLLSWLVVHTVYAARYARIYYMGPDGGVNFNQQEPPCFTDFAYMAFTIGATFQVSDTNLTSTEMRRAVLRHSMVSYLFGAFTIAVTVNLLAG